MKKIFDEFKEGIKNFGSNISTIVNTILLLLVYLMGIGITSLVAKLFKKHFLQKKNLNNKSYWTDLNLKNKQKEDYLRQF